MFSEIFNRWIFKFSWVEIYPIYGMLMFKLHVELLHVQCTCMSYMYISGTHAPFAFLCRLVMTMVPSSCTPLCSKSWSTPHSLPANSPRLDPCPPSWNWLATYGMTRPLPPPSLVTPPSLYYPDGYCTTRLVLIGAQLYSRYNTIL